MAPLIPRNSKCVAYIRHLSGRMSSFYDKAIGVSGVHHCFHRLGPCALALQIKKKKPLSGESVSGLNCRRSAEDELEYLDTSFQVEVG